MYGRRETVVVCVLVFCTFSLLDAAQHRPNHRKGICVLEVPTQDLLSPEDRHGANLHGNGSRPGFSKIEICCSGYEKVPHSYYKCEPICEGGCINGNCTAPNVCECKRGYIKINSTCIPTCPFGCLNGICTNSGMCSCNAGYQQSADRKYCTPHCTGGCGTGGTCTGPETCTCSKGFAVNKDTRKCEYHCEGGCGQGTCIGPNTCSCKVGYKLLQNGCVPDCPKGCLNGECTAPNRCSCKPGWNLDAATNSICTPHCTQTCLNADCVAPNTCACKKGYVQSPGPEGLYKCVAFCPNGCPNGVCSAPNFCICNPGFIKEFKGSNVCIRRFRRSIMHFELIPEEILEGQ
ncbi:von Willebrand factor D and EGF domain-containing protein-like isoform X2 [Anoplophora glabripennis]|uniref:von Willebrand factor D and EGF domain-containing protein-like isoform X2 n=1 Tax=Anoplophora glabripennis TaxID=217634 RepID=UPI000874D3EA|nr:von Willebrand factor D and EGF domain-containing protein-like isoform X2 [Anoplophora glabripennis]